LQQQQVNQALDNIPGEQRLCLELAYFEGMSQSQIAEYTSTPLGTIKTRMRIGMEKLERLLRASGYPE
jgi:RNA polymerase sigma-70 factor (ECF subfamily)